jgi:hypothetical protein
LIRAYGSKCLVSQLFGLIFGVFERIPDYSDVEKGMDFFLKTISTGASGGDVKFEGLKDRFDELRTGCFFQKFRSLGIQWNSFLRYRLEGTAHTSFLN